MAETTPENAYELGRHYERTYGGCSQCVVAALQDTYDTRNDEILRAATGLAAGGGGEHGAPAAAEHEPERSNEFSDGFFYKRHVSLPQGWRTGKACSPT